MFVCACSCFGHDSEKTVHVWILILDMLVPHCEMLRLIVFQCQRSRSIKVYCGHDSEKTVHILRILILDMLVPHCKKVCLIDLKFQRSKSLRVTIKISCGHDLENPIPLRICKHVMLDTDLIVRRCVHLIFLVRHQ